MSAILLSVALISAPPARAPGAAAAPHLEGKWLIVYVEEGGKRNATWEQQVATAKDDTLTYSKDGDERTLKLSYGDHQTVKVAASGGKGTDKLSAEMSGVYIAAQDYFCLSLNPAGAKEGAGGSSASFILILRKQR